MTRTTRRQKHSTRSTRKHTRATALRELARRYPKVEHVGFEWKNPFNKASRGIRWTQKDLAMFRKFQQELKA